MKHIFVADRIIFNKRLFLLDWETFLQVQARFFSEPRNNLDISRWLPEFFQDAFHTTIIDATFIVQSFKQVYANIRESRAC